MDRESEEREETLLNLAPKCEALYLGWCDMGQRHIIRDPAWLDLFGIDVLKGYEWNYYVGHCGSTWSLEPRRINTGETGTIANTTVSAAASPH